MKRISRSVLLIVITACVFSLLFKILWTPQQRTVAAVVVSGTATTAPALIPRVDQPERTVEVAVPPPPVLQVAADSGAWALKENEIGVTRDGEEKKITVDFEDEDVRSILTKIAASYGLNVVMPDGLTGRASLKLTDEEWQEAFLQVLEPRFYGFIRKDDRIEIIESGGTAGKMVLDFTNTDLREFLGIIASMNRLELDIPNELLGNVTLNAVNVRWPQIVREVLTQSGYTFIGDDKGFKVIKDDSR